MKRKRKNLIKKLTALALILSLSFALSSFTVVASNDIKVLLDGTPINFDVPPQIIDGRTMVPMRAIFEVMGATVDWDENKKSIGAIKGSTLIIMVIGEKTYLSKNGVSTLDVPPQIINGRTLVPARAVAECFDCNVTWDNASRTVLITTSNNSKNNNVSKFYSNTTIPTYESITGSNLRRTIDHLEPVANFSKEVYEYPYDSSLEKKYVSALQQSGFEETQNFDEFRVFVNSSTGNRILLQGANGGDGSGILWIRIGTGPSDSNTSPNNQTSLAPSASSYNVYKGTSLPTYTSVTGVKLKEERKTSDGDPIYVYTYTNAADVGQYWSKLFSLGWKTLQEDSSETSDIYESSLYKGSSFVILNVYLRINEIWITYN